MSRAPHDPFTSSSNAPSSLRQASVAPTRSRQQAPSLFAPSLLRRPTSRTTPRVEEGVVLQDSDSEEDASLLGLARRPRQQQQQLRRARHGSPDNSRHARLRPRQQAEEQDIVHRQPDGSYLLGASTLGIAAPQAMFGMGQQEGEMTTEQLDNYHRDLARRYFTSGTHMGGRHSRAAEDGELSYFHIGREQERLLRPTC